MRGYQNKYDILNKAKGRGQLVLVELPRVSKKDNPLPRVKARQMAIKERKEQVRKEGTIYDYAKEHPELCPPVGTVIKIQSKYGVRAKLIIDMVFAGLPGTLFEMLPVSEQPQHLQDGDLLARHIDGAGRPGWTQWPDTHAWKLWQKRAWKKDEQVKDEQTHQTL